MPNISATTLLLAAMLLPGVVRAEDTYRVRFAADLATVAVEACFDGSMPGALHRSRQSGPYALGLRAGDRVLETDSNDEWLELPDLPPDTCVSWEVDLAAAAKGLDYRHVLRTGDALLTRADFWFWQDTDREPPRVTVASEPGWSISTSWKELPSSGGESVFRPEATPPSWTSRFAIGRFHSRDVNLPGSALRLAILGDASEEQAAMLENWIRVSAQSVASVFGRFPQPRPQVLVIAVGPQSGPVPWAHVIRGGGIAAEFFVDPRHGAEKFAADWTATHELSHMLLPYVARNDRWLSEGIASYYQNVLRARDRRLTEVEAWQKLHAGFLRGQVNTGDPATRPSRNPGVMRTYWGGAAMMLTADAELRARSDGRQSLDTALAALNDCCRDAGKRWTARELFAQLDRLTGFPVFTDLHRAFERSGEFPDISGTYAKLGLVPGEERMTIDRDAPWGRIRHYIMNSSPAPADRHASGGTY